MRGISPWAPLCGLLCIGVQAVGWAHPDIEAPPGVACNVTGDTIASISDAQLEINEALGIAAPANDLNNDGVVNALDVQVVINAVVGLGCSLPAANPPSIADFNPKSGPIGTLVTLTGGNFGSSPQVSMPAQGGGTIAVPLTTVISNSLTFTIPSGAATGAIAINNGSGSASTASPFTVTPASTFSITVSPSSANLIQGQSVAYAVQASSSNGFDQLAQLSATGIPSGVTASFTPSSVQAGQTAVLTLTAPSNQAITTANLSITASASVQNLPVTQSASVSLAVVAPTTSLIGRTVVSNPQQTPLAGVTVSSLAQDGNGNTTLCTGFTTVSDAAGNFALTNLPQGCTGQQLFNFNGMTATSPSGQYAGVNLVFTLVLGQVTPSPVLVHLPRIDNVETFNVTQNASVNQTYNFTTIPGLSVTVYANTTLTLPGGGTPNPFPLAAVQVPVDRLPDNKPNVPTMVRVFIVAFQPAESTASQPVAITFPNVSNTPPGTDMPLMTLNPLYGSMVPYGTGAVSADGTQVVPDMDPAHSGHRYGLVHFDWHGQMPPGPNQDNPNCGCQGEGGGAGKKTGASPGGGDPVDLSSGLQMVQATDIAIRGARAPIGISRTYRTLTTVAGPFGLGWQFTYSWELSTGAPNSASAIYLIAPDGNQYLFSRQTNGTLTNATVPFLQGAVMTTNASGSTTLRYPNGATYQFQAFAGISTLSSITDRNSNAITFTETPLNSTTIRITKIADPVGRTLTLAYNASGYCTSVTDSTGRQATYTYNSSGTLATVTDPAGQTTTYQYDSQNRMVSETDARGVVIFQNVFDSNGHVVQQTQANGGVFNFAYTMANSLAATSPIVATTVTDPLGNQTTYRFNIQGYLTDVIDALGQMKSFTLDPETNQVLQTTGSVQCAVCGPPGQGPMTYTYDGQGNLLTSTDALGDTFTYTYDATFNQVTSITDPLHHTQTLKYDTSGNLTSYTDANGNITSFTFDTHGQPVTVTDPAGNTTTIAYDSLENPITATDPLGNTTTSAFDGLSRVISTTDALGRKTGFQYDGVNRILSVHDGRNNTTSFSYDAVGNLLSVTDPRGSTTTLTYSNMSLMTSRVNALGRTESYQYNLVGDIGQYTDARGQVTTLQYDALNRLSSETYQDGSTVTRHYDPYSRLLAVNDSVGGAFNFAYDAVGRMVTQSEPTGTLSYGYDALNRRISRQVMGQPAVTYTYDNAGNLTGASTPAAGASFTYDARNLPAKETRTNGVTSTYSFNAIGQIMSLIHANGGTALNTQTFVYDPVGNRIGGSNDISQPLITQTAAASVDAANQLLTNAQTAYTNDANGNRLTESGPNGSYTYVWDARNRLASITDGSGSRTTFQYDFMRNLTEIDKTGAAASSQKFVFDSFTNVVSLTDASGLPVSLLTGNSLDSHIASVDSAGNVTFGIDDPLGTITATTSASGGIQAKLLFEPYGQTTGTSPAAFPFTFTGRVPLTGNIVYYRNRVYDSGVGRFLSRDPLDMLSGHSNLFRYAGNNPTAFNDPLGLNPADEAKEALDKVGNRIDEITGSSQKLSYIPAAGISAEFGESLEKFVAKPFGWFTRGFTFAKAYHDNGAAGVAGQAAGVATGALVTSAIDVGIPVLITTALPVTLSLEIALGVGAAVAAAPTVAAIAAVAVVVGTAWLADWAADKASCAVTNWLK